MSILTSVVKDQPKAPCFSLTNRLELACIVAKSPFGCVTNPQRTPNNFFAGFFYGLKEMDDRRPDARNRGEKRMAMKRSREIKVEGKSAERQEVFVRRVALIECEGFKSYMVLWAKVYGRLARNP